MGLPSSGRIFRSDASRAAEQPRSSPAAASRAGQLPVAGASGSSRRGRHRAARSRTADLASDDLRPRAPLSLERAGLVSRVPYRDGGGGIVAITRKGAAWVRDDDLPTVVPKSEVTTTGVHSRAVSWVVANIEVRGGFWRGPAELRQDKSWRVRRDDGAGHLPDLGVITSEDTRIAIEVELHSKSNSRLRSILRGYSIQVARGRLSHVGYVYTRPAVARAVRRQAEAVHFRGNGIRFARLDQLIEEVRERAASSNDWATGP